MLAHLPANGLLSGRVIAKGMLETRRQETWPLQRPMARCNERCSAATTSNASLLQHPVCAASGATSSTAPQISVTAALAAPSMRCVRRHPWRKRTHPCGGGAL